MDNGNTWTCYINTGKGFNTTYQNIVNTEYGDKITVIDINRDGLSDLIQLRGTQARLYLNSKGIIQSTTNVNPISITGTSDFMPSNVINYYSSSYLVCIKTITRIWQAGETTFQQPPTGAIHMLHPYFP